MCVCLQWHVQLDGEHGPGGNGTESPEQPEAQECEGVEVRVVD